MPRLAYQFTTSRPGSFGLSPRARRFGRVVQILGGALVLGAGYLLGARQAPLALRGERATGTIVAMKQESWQSRTRTGTSFRTAQLPIVEYRVADRTIRFEDWLSRRGEVVGRVVPVRYDVNDPSIAMIDRPIWNWIPWGPTVAIGVLVMVSGIVGLARLSGQRDST